MEMGGKGGKERSQQQSSEDWGGKSKVNIWAKANSRMMLFWGRRKGKVVGESICKLLQVASSGGGYSFSLLTTSSSFSGAVAQTGCKWRRREANACYCYCFISPLNLRHSRRIYIHIFLIKKFSLESFKPIWEPVFTDEWLLKFSSSVLSERLVKGKKNYPVSCNSR